MSATQESEADSPHPRRHPAEPRADALGGDALDLVTEARRRLREWDHSAADVRVAIAPARVNLIGEHTDYNDGFVLPMAIDRYVAVAAARREDRALRVRSLDFAEERLLSLDALAPPSRPSWSDYVAGVAWSLQTAGIALAGADIVVCGNVPVGAGLSSSAALEVASAIAMLSVRDAGSAAVPDAMTLARLAQRAEHTYAGVQCGLMDQVASAASVASRVLLLDCRSLEIELVPVPASVSVIVMDTMMRRELAGSAYNERRASCERVVHALQTVDAGIRALRDVDEQLLVRMRDRIGEIDASRALHVVREMDRPRRLRDAFVRADLSLAGRLMNDSHESLRVLYEVSCPELDIMCAAARESPGCLGARMTGAGFGGCAIALVRSQAAHPFIEEVARRYAGATGTQGRFFATRPVAGGRLA